MQFQFSHSVANGEHALTGICGVVTVRIPAQQLGKIPEGLELFARVAGRDVNREVAGGQPYVQVVRGQPPHVQRVVCVFALWVQAQEAVGGGAGAFQVQVLVAGENQVQLGLLGITAKRVIGFQCIQILLGLVEIAGVHGATGIFIICLFRQHLLLSGVVGAGADHGHQGG